MGLGPGRPASPLGVGSHHKTPPVPHGRPDRSTYLPPVWGYLVPITSMDESESEDDSDCDPLHPEGAPERAAAEG